MKKNDQASISPPGGDSKKSGQLWMIAAVILAIVAIAATITALSWRTKVTNYDRNLSDCLLAMEEMEAEVEATERNVARLERQVEMARLFKYETSLIPEKYIQSFREKGLNNPKYAIELDLYKRRDLIPCQPLEGRTMRFESRDEIKVLSPDRVFAAFSDGEIVGWMYLSYRVKDDGTISWKIIDSYCPHYDD